MKLKTFFSEILRYEKNWFSASTKQILRSLYNRSFWCVTIMKGQISIESSKTNSLRICGIVLFPTIIPNIKLNTNILFYIKNNNNKLKNLKTRNLKITCYYCNKRTYIRRCDNFNPSCGPPVRWAILPTDTRIKSQLLLPTATQISQIYYFLLPHRLSQIYLTSFKSTKDKCQR